MRDEKEFDQFVLTRFQANDEFYKRVKQSFRKAGPTVSPRQHRYLVTSASPVKLDNRMKGMPNMILTLAICNFSCDAENSRLEW